MSEYSENRGNFLEEVWLSANEAWRVLTQPGRTRRSYRPRVPDLEPGGWRPGYLSSCLLMCGYYRSLGLFSEVCGDFGGPSPVGKIKSNQILGESSGWGHRQAGSAHWPTGKPQSHLLLGFSV